MSIVGYWFLFFLDKCRLKKFCDFYVLKHGKGEVLDVARVHNRFVELKTPLDRTIFYGKCNSQDDTRLITKVLRFTDNIRNAGAVLVWGAWSSNADLIKLAIKHRKPVVFVEDGFIRSVCSNAQPVPLKYRQGMSFAIDHQAFHFCGALESDLEILLNSYKVTDLQLQKSNALINKIIVNKISKYNSQKLTSLSEITDDTQEAVLVVDQSYGDQSLIYGLTDTSVFERMLNDAIKENPGKRVYFKVHPDNKALRKQAYFKVPEQVKVVDDISPLDLMSQVKIVYVATSQLGFEALMLGKRVKVYGMPFYAGWGLTEDQLNNSRRKRKLTFAELFYIVYFVYIVYATPELGKCSPDDVVDRIIRQRSEYFQHYPDIE